MNSNNHQNNNINSLYQSLTSNPTNLNYNKDNNTEEESREVIDILSEGQDSIDTSLILKRSTTENNDINNNNQEETKSLPTTQYSAKSKKREVLGYILMICANTCWACNSVYLKIIQKIFLQEFNNLTFIFSRGMGAMIISFCASKIVNKPILRWNQIQFKKHFLLKTNISFFSMFLWTMAMWYLRVSTSQIISTMQPIIVIILSIFFLNEKFFMRYFWGILLCTIGSIIIINNEKHSKTPTRSENVSHSELIRGIFIGVLCNFFSMFVGGFISIADKVLATNKVPISTQLFYLGMFHSLNSIICMIIFRSHNLDYKLIILSSFHAILFFTGNFLYNRALQLIDLSVSSLFGYLRIVFVFILGWLLLGESIFFSDIIGACFIVSYMVYNVLYPLKKK